MSNRESVESVVFKLKTGEEIQVEIDQEGRLGEVGYRIRVTALRGLLVVQGRADNRVDILTAKSLIEEERVVQSVAQERRSSKAPSGDRRN